MITSVTKLAACLAVILAIVILPSSATHAATSMHSGHDGSIGAADLAQAHAKHSIQEVTGIARNCGGHVEKSDVGHTSSLCCSGICLSVVLLESEFNIGTHLVGFEYFLQAGLLISVEPFGFLEPPKHLI